MIFKPLASLDYIHIFASACLGLKEVLSFEFYALG